MLSGWSCPFAKECLSLVRIVDGKREIKDGKFTKFRCFSASQEALYTAVYASRKHNYDTLKAHEHDTDAMFNLLAESMPKNLGICRIHVAGDMFSQEYFDAWIKLAYCQPERLFYAYTKSLPYWQARRRQLRKVPNLVLTASRGGREDRMIKRHRLREAIVVFNENVEWEIDNDDSHAAIPSQRTKNFALLIHGTQPKGSEAGKAVKALKGKGSYGKRK